MNARIILQDRQTQMYFQSGHRWTSEIVEAMDFRYALIALDFALSMGFLQADIVMSFDNPVYDFRLALGTCEGQLV